MTQKKESKERPMDELLRPDIREKLSLHLHKADLKMHPLVGDASSRRYSRLTSGEKSWILMESEPFDPETYPLLSVQIHFKKHHVLVPEILTYSGELGFILYEDLGDHTLEHEFYRTRNPYGVLGLYRMALDELLKIHLIASKDPSNCVGFNLEFDVEKLTWELHWTQQYFFQELLKQPVIPLELEKEFHQIATILAQPKKYLQHRDYHSRNLMVYENKIRVIDFQDARMGLVQYDLVSLLRDAYVPIPRSLELELLDYYCHRSAQDFDHPWSPDDFMNLYEIQSIQRLLKAVGSFASFAVRRNDRRYLKYIPPTMRRVQDGLQQLGAFPVLHQLLQNLGAYEWSEAPLG